MPAFSLRGRGRQVFFWSSCGGDPVVAYEDAAYKALAHLQSIYNFVIEDYNYQTSFFL